VILLLETAMLEILSRQGPILLVAPKPKSTLVFMVLGTI
jgi:hypothetical protein